MSKIEWTEQTWNPIIGCSIVSPGCTNCYAMKMAHRLGKNPKTPQYAGLTRVVNGNPVWTGQLHFNRDRLAEPLKRKKPTMYFVNSMSDLFHEDAEDDWIDQIFAVMALAPQHTFQVLTKRAERMRAYLEDMDYRADLWNSHAGVLMHWDDMPQRDPGPLSNVWLGVSVEDNARLGRIQHLINTPAFVRFVSFEPLLGYVAARRYIHLIDWAIVGGESGDGARPLNLAWARQIVEQCREAGVACFVKQLGQRPYETRPAEGRPPGIDHALANLGARHPQRSWFPDWTLVHKGPESAWYRYHRFKHRKGGDMSEWPAELRVREMPGHHGDVR